MTVTQILFAVRQVVRWDFHEMRMALSSDLTIYQTPDHPAFTIKALDTTSELELSTCLDFYLDNVISNVPELAVALHAKGFVRGVKFMKTDSIPHIDPATIGDSLLPPEREFYASLSTSTTTSSLPSVPNLSKVGGSGGGVPIIGGQELCRARSTSIEASSGSFPAASRSLDNLAAASGLLASPPLPSKSAEDLALLLSSAESSPRTRRSVA